MAEKMIRIGVVGAGANTRERHIPGFRALSNVEVVGVVNRTRESSERVARELGIPGVYADWQSLISDPDVDAVCVGTWPNLHAEVTCAALDAGKHVLTEARMARNAAEAHQMLAASQRHPELVAQIVPSPYGLVQDEFVRSLIATGYLGSLREVVVLGADNAFWDYTQPLHWRQDVEISGRNVLALGILHETLLRWAPRPLQVLAQTAIFEPTRPAPDRPGQVPVTVPDNVQILTQLEGGARGLYHFSGVALFGPGKQIHLYGSHGTIKYLSTPYERLLCGRMGDRELLEIDIPQEKRGGWRVEAEFVGAIRGNEPVRYTDFSTGVQYMEFVEAVARSAATQSAIALPLAKP